MSYIQINPQYAKNVQFYAFHGAMDCEKGKQSVEIPFQEYKDAATKSEDDVTSIQFKHVGDYYITFTFLFNKKFEIDDHPCTLFWRADEDPVLQIESKWSTVDNDLGLRIRNKVHVFEPFTTDVSIQRDDVAFTLQCASVILEHLHT